MKIKINSVGYTECPLSWSWDTKEHSWYDYDLWFVLNGRGELRTDSCVYSLERGSCFCLRGGERYIGTHDKTAPLRVVNVHYDYLSEEDSPLRNCSLAPDLYRHLSNMSFMENLSIRLLNSLDNGNIPTDSTYLWLNCILDELYREDTLLEKKGAVKIPAIISFVKSEIAASCYNQHKIYDIAKKFNYNPDHLTRLFKKHTGYTLEKYVIVMRIQQASNLLKDSNMQVCEIADALGYKDVSHFSKQYRKVTGISPTAFRKSSDLTFLK